MTKDATVNLYSTALLGFMSLCDVDKMIFLIALALSYGSELGAKL